VTRKFFSRDLLIEERKHQLVGLRSHPFGLTSETSDQPELMLNEEGIRRRRRGHLPRYETLFVARDAFGGRL